MYHGLMPEQSNSSALLAVNKLSSERNPICLTGLENSLNEKQRSKEKYHLFKHAMVDADSLVETRGNRRNGIP